MTPEPDGPAARAQVTVPVPSVLMIAQQVMGPGTKVTGMGLDDLIDQVTGCYVRYQRSGPQGVAAQYQYAANALVDAQRLLKAAEQQQDELDGRTLDELGCMAEVSLFLAYAYIRQAVQMNSYATGLEMAAARERTAP